MTIQAIRAVRAVVIGTLACWGCDGSSPPAVVTQSSADSEVGDQESRLDGIIAVGLALSDAAKYPEALAKAKEAFRIAEASRHEAGKGGVAVCDDSPF